ncbi:ISAs1 family transposase [Simulacricoccus sp. 17bor-14]|nr:ISAs1 family transposase [Simulacricoccus sp. 17bor-14]
MERTKRHPLLNVLVLALCGAVCGADGWDELALFAKSKRALFSKVLPLAQGTPSADTFRRVLSSLHPARFEECMRAWVAALAEELAGQVVALDGKAVRGALSRATSGALRPLHLLHAWAAEQDLLLGQVAVAGAPGEVAGLPALIGLLDVQGAVLTADANGCTGDVAAAAQEAGADYVLCLKGNREKLHGHVVALFEAAGPHPAGTHVTHAAGHGREEVRRVSALPLTDWPLKGPRWTGAGTCVRVERHRGGGVGASLEVHYYLTSLPPDAARLAHVIRTHWGVENGLHWVLDVAFNEDRRRIRDAAGAQNFAALSRLALALLKREASLKAGIAAKRKKAGWDDAYLLQVLSAGIAEV